MFARDRLGPAAFPEPDRLEQRAVLRTNGWTSNTAARHAGSPTGLTMSGAGWSAYSSSKASVMGLTRVMAADLAKYGIRVNSIVPGSITTPLTKVLHDEGMIPFVEPFAKLMNQGMLLAYTPHRRMEAGESVESEGDDDDAESRDLIPLFPEELANYPADKVIWKYVKMSKSKRNVITPDAMAEKFGADALRTYELFVAPFEDAIQWSEDGMNGAYRFMGRVWRLVNEWLERFDPDWASKVAEEAAADPKAKALRRKVHQTIRKVGEDIEDFAFNTAVAALIRNEIEDVRRRNSNRVLVDDSEERLQIMGDSAQRVRSAPASEELQIVINQRQPKPQHQLPISPTRAHQTRHQNGHFRPSSSIGR